MDSQATGVAHTRLLLLNRGALDWARVEDGDPPLSDAGRLEVELTAATLPRFDHVTASRQRATREASELLGVIRGVSASWRDDLDEVRPAGALLDAAAYGVWLDRLLDQRGDDAGGETLQDGVHRLTVAMRALASQWHGRTVLVHSHPVVLLGFLARQFATAVTRWQVDALPDLALAVVDCVEGRFYVVKDFPVRWSVA